MYDRRPTNNERRKMIAPYQGKQPIVDPSAYIVDSAYVIGDVQIGANSSVWFGCSVRGDVGPIVIGQRSNIQDLTIIHETTGQMPVIIGSDVTVGHRVILHSCTISSCCLIGMGAIILDGANIGEYSVVGAGSLITENTKIPPRSLAFGSPAKVIRQLTPEESENIIFAANHYVEYSKVYKEEGWASSK